MEATQSTENLQWMTIETVDVDFAVEELQIMGCQVAHVEDNDILTDATAEQIEQAAAAADEFNAGL